LPEAQFNKWKPQYNEIVEKIIKLEKEQNIPFDSKKADELIEYMAIHGPGFLEKREIDYLNQNIDLDTKYGMQLEEIEKIYNEKKSITELERAVKNYVEIWKEILEKAKG